MGELVRLKFTFNTIPILLFLPLSVSHSATYDFVGILPRHFLQYFNLYNHIYDTASIMASPNSSAV